MRGSHSAAVNSGGTHRPYARRAISSKETPTRPSSACGIRRFCCTDPSGATRPARGTLGSHGGPRTQIPNTFIAMELVSLLRRRTRAAYRLIDSVSCRMPAAEHGDACTGRCGLAYCTYIQPNGPVRRRTIGQLAKTSARALEPLVGCAAGEKLAALSWNHDPREIRTQRRARSAGAQSALGLKPAQPKIYQPALRHLADRIATRLRARSVCGSTVTVRIRFAKAPLCCIPIAASRTSFASWRRKN